MNLLPGCINPVVYITGSAVCINNYDVPGLIITFVHAADRLVQLALFSFNVTGTMNWPLSIQYNHNPQKKLQ